MKALTLLGNAWTMVSIVWYVIDADFIDKLNCFEVEKTEIIPDNFRILISELSPSDYQTTSIVCTPITVKVLDNFHA